MAATSTLGLTLCAFLALMCLINAGKSHECDDQTCTSVDGEQRESSDTSTSDTSSLLQLRSVAQADLVSSTLPVRVGQNVDSKEKHKKEQNGTFIVQVWSPTPPAEYMGIPFWYKDPTDLYYCFEIKYPYTRVHAFFDCNSTLAPGGIALKYQFPAEHGEWSCEGMDRVAFIVKEEYLEAFLSGKKVPSESGNHVQSNRPLPNGCNEKAQKAMRRRRTARV
eukprot:TRINITY_DN38937_c0_g1_i1.p1 TRINITY_DN38937_c0_g1~~TRINITY_DN38937_c0_g1_i1.p1  ORF type:complete len:236 (+),score=27.82 TRINITY_DN38937_c0_g1_i1:47-709(+)